LPRQKLDYGGDITSKTGDFIRFLQRHKGISPITIENLPTDFFDLFFLFKLNMKQQNWE